MPAVYSWKTPLERMMDTTPSAWTSADLEPLRVEDLRYLARFLGVSHSGTGATIRARLLDAADLRTTLAEFENDPQALADRFKLRELRGMCRRAKIYIARNKYGAAAGLLNWRNGCRRRGREELAYFWYQRKQQPQLSLPLT